MARTPTATRLKIALATTLLAHTSLHPALAQNNLAGTAAGIGTSANIAAQPVAGHLTRYVPPITPRQAKEEHITGTVSLAVTVAPTGQVATVDVVSAPPLLGQAAAAAVKQWTYTPWRVDGKPVEGHLTVHINF